MSDCKRVLLVEDDKRMCAEFYSAVGRTDDFIMIATTGIEEEGMEIITAGGVDLLLLDLELKSGSGVSMLEKMQKMAIRPLTIVITNSQSRVVLDAVRKLGADYIYTKYNDVYSPDEVLHMAELMYDSYIEVQEIRDKDDVEKQNRYDQSMRRRTRIERFLVSLGFVRSHAGFEYITEGMLLMQDRGEAPFHITQDIYEVIAEHHDTSWNNVEHAIRFAIATVWDKTDTSTLQSIFSEYFSRFKDSDTVPRPSNTLFFLMLAEELVR